MTALPSPRTARRRISIVVGTAAATALLLAGCSGDPLASGSADADRVTIVLAEEPSSLDACDTQGSSAIPLRGNIVQSLTDFDAETGDVVPLLATSWEQASPTEWDFQLRDDVTFQDGSAFDADAVVTSIERTMNADLGCQNLDLFDAPITATALSATSVRITSPSPDPILPRRIGFVDISAPSTPEDAKTQEPIGTGPYALAEYAPNQYIDLETWDGYWGDEPAVKSARFIARNEDSVRADIVKTGEADLSMPIAVQDATDSTAEFAENRVFFLRIPTDTAPYDDPRIRSAIAQAVDKEQIVGSLMGRAGTVTDQINAPTVNSYLDDYEGPAFDPDAAATLVSDAAADGVDVTTPLKLVAPTDLFPGSREVIQAIQQNLEDVGLSVDIETADGDAFADFLYTDTGSDNASILAVSHDNVSGDASFTFNRYVAGGGCCSTVRSAEVDAAVALGNASQDDDRAAAFQEAARLAYEDGAFVPIAEQKTLVMVGSRVAYEPNGLTAVRLLVSDISFTG